MAVGYQLDAALGLTLTIFDGKITAEEWRSVVGEVFNDPGWPPGPLNLTDLRTADPSALTATDRQEILAINGLHTDKLAGMKSAVIGGPNFDAVREFGRNDTTSGLRLIAFDDLPNACAWLGVDIERVRQMVEQLRRTVRAPTTPTDPAPPAG